MAPGDRENKNIGKALIQGLGNRGWATILSVPLYRFTPVEDIHEKALAFGLWCGQGEFIT
jgi:hypothetical protein